MKAVIFIISLFTALAVATNAMSYSYATQAPVLQQLGGSPVMTISAIASEGSIKVKASVLQVGSISTLILASEDVETLLNMLQAKFEGMPPRYGEVLIGGALIPLTSEGKININGEAFKVTGVIKGPSHLSWIAVIADDTLEALALSETTEVYLSSQPTASSLDAAPSLHAVVKGVVGEALYFLRTIVYLFYALLAISSAILGYAAMVEASPTFRVFKALNASGKKMTTSLIVFSILLAASCVGLGYAIGVLLSGLASSLVSFVMKLPHIRPVTEAEILPMLGLAFLAASTSLATGLVKGYLATLDRN